LVCREVEQEIADPHHPDDKGSGYGPARGERCERGRHIQKIDAHLSLAE
jgi:hypothetical protein